MIRIITDIYIAPFKVPKVTSTVRGTSDMWDLERAVYIYSVLSP